MKLAISVKIIDNTYIYVYTVYICIYVNNYIYNDIHTYIKIYSIGAYFSEQSIFINKIIYIYVGLSGNRVPHNLMIHQHVPIQVAIWEV